MGSACASSSRCLGYILCFRGQKVFSFHFASKNMFPIPFRLKGVHLQWKGKRGEKWIFTEREGKGKVTDYLPSNHFGGAKEGGTSVEAKYREGPKKMVRDVETAKIVTTFLLAKSSHSTFYQTVKRLGAYFERIFQSSATNHSLVQHSRHTCVFVILYFFQFCYQIMNLYFIKSLLEQWELQGYKRFFKCSENPWNIWVWKVSLLSLHALPFLSQKLNNAKIPKRVKKLSHPLTPSPFLPLSPPFRCTVQVWEGRKGGGGKPLVTNFTFQLHSLEEEEEEKAPGVILPFFFVCGKLRSQGKKFSVARISGGPAPWPRKKYGKCFLKQKLHFWRQCSATRN